MTTDFWSPHMMQAILHIWTKGENRIRERSLGEGGGSMGGEEGGRWRRRQSLSQSFKVGTPKLHKTNTCLTHMYCSDTHAKHPHNSRQSEGYQSFPVWSPVLYTVILGLRWIREHSVQEEQPFHSHANPLHFLLITSIGVCMFVCLSVCVG